MIVDCANGSAAHLAPALFRSWVRECVRSAHAPDGRNINLNCGSLHLDRCARPCFVNGADLGVAFDGDADRALFVSGSGKIVDGDAVIC